MWPPKRIPKTHWSNFHFNLMHSHPRGWENSFLSLAGEFSLHFYPELQISKKGPEAAKSKKVKPLLDYALYPSGVAPYLAWTQPRWSIL